MLAVTGANGQLGYFVLRYLITQTDPSNVLALVRNPERDHDLKPLGVKIRQADYDDPSTWPKALAGVERLLLISSSSMSGRAAQHKTVVEAAARAKIKRLVYTSVLQADTTPLAMARDHLETEQAIKECGLTYTVLRNGWYLENHSVGFGPVGGVREAVKQGVIHGATQNGRFSSAAREDYGAAAAGVLAGAGHENKTYELAGDTSFDLTEWAAEIARQSGQPVFYQDHPVAEYKQFLSGLGLPDPLVNRLADSNVAVSKGALESHSKDLSTLIGRPTTPFSEAIRKALR